MIEKSRPSSSVNGSEPFPTVRLQILGGISLQVADARITDDNNRSLKLWSVLCYLILNRGRAVTQAELIENFWAEDGGSNPLSALKMLILRLRTMLEPMLKADIKPILSRRRVYQWNPDIPCEVDAEEFESLCREAGRPETPSERQAELYREAISLYKGDPLPKQSDQQWVISLTSRCHDEYINAVKAYAALLEAAGQHKEMGNLCIRASALAPLDEQIHILILRALLLQNKATSALRHYERATKLLYENLGVRPSEDMRSLYLRIMAEEKKPEQDLDQILFSMRESYVQSGAFFCEYGFFEKIYQLEVRRVTRVGGCLHVALITLSAPEHRKTSLKVLNAVMESLQETITQNLRKGDVVARYSKDQFIVMLPHANLEDSTMVMERILTAFQGRLRKSPLTVSYKLQGLEAS